ncbi:hypothetical protein L3X38_016845 [Prunus dulcis]|uniref:Uncharacterized protein n=1 Tax=Prunus dulcis TaxID=3755 RepID=A0AAD4W686_PRUDU|nr:hypothetical protein L3X38_016845 [Prunus dulcis]
MESLDHLVHRSSHAARMEFLIKLLILSVDFKEWLFINIKASFSCIQGIPLVLYVFVLLVFLLEMAIEQNNDANHMAHMGQNSNLGYHVVDLPPPIGSLLANDSVRMTTARLVPVYFF